MNIFFIISYILLFIYSAVNIILTLVDHYHKKHQFDINQFNIAELEAMGQIKAKKNTYEKEIKEEIEQEVESYRATAKEQIQFEKEETKRKLEALNQQEKDFQRTIDARIKQSQEQFEERLEHYKELDTAAQRELVFPFIKIPFTNLNKVMFIFTHRTI